MSAVQGIEAVLNRFAQMQKAANNMQKPLKASAVYMFGSIERNFKAQGRPQKWQKLSNATLARRRKGQDNEGGKKKPQILINSARLKNSVTSEEDSLNVTSGGFTIGTNVIYARRQHFGYPGKAGRGHSKTPARPYLMFQQEDSDAILKIFNRHFGIK